ncbi:MAG: lipase secretion chaperone [Oleiphilus sp.]
MNKFFLSLGLAALAISAVAVFYSEHETKHPTPSNLAVVTDARSSERTPLIPKQLSTSSTLEEMPNEQTGFPEIERLDQGEAAISPFLIESVYIDELLAIFEDGYTLDDTQKAALDIFISRLPDKLSDAELNLLVKQIQAHADSDSGDQLGLTINRLYKLRQAEDSFIQSLSPPSNQEDMNQINTELALLRLRILGEALNAKLHPPEPAKATPTAPSETHNTNTSGENVNQETGQWINSLSKQGLTDDEINQLIAEKYGNDTSASLQKLQAVEDEWLQRYLKFSEQKSYIVESGLSEEDKAEQIEALLKVHYSAEEFKGAAAFDKLMSEQE